MILIFSDYEDASTNNVIDWLNFYKANYLRINPEDTKHIHFHYSLNNKDITAFIYLNASCINIKNIDAIWYRRGGIMTLETSVQYSLNNVNLENEIKKICKKEYGAISEYLIYLFQQKKSIGSYEKYSVNKLQTLCIANDIGLDVPETIITTSKIHLLKFIEKHVNVINKAILDGIHSPHGNYMYHTFTELVDMNFINNLPETFQPACFQEELKKKFEVRTFFLDGKFFSMAIFSQTDKRTKIDFRKYIYDKENKTIPFNLPNYIEEKLSKLMLRLKLNCGSFDIVYTQEKKFVFLEVNPVGQYGMVSFPCNYSLDKIIAQKLMNF